MASLTRDNLRRYRLAEIIADAQSEQLQYANLALRSLRVREIRTTQLEAALAMQPDLLSVFAGANDLLGVTVDFGAIRAELAAIFHGARATGRTVLTFTMPDPSSVNPFGRRLRGRMFRFNDIVRADGDRFGVLIMDFERYPIIEEPRLFSEDRLHGNELGHERVARAMAWRLGIEGADMSWAEPLPQAPRPRSREQFDGHVAWARHYFAPWIGIGIGLVPRPNGLAPKRPLLTPVPKHDH